jgi:RluA family pseudouridine synthase
VEPEVSPDVRILHEDEAIIVLQKPAPLPVHPSGRFNRNTLQYFLHAAYHPQKPRAAHRLDANTTGLLVCTRTRHFAGLLQTQFARREVDKIYLVKVGGHPAWDQFVSEASISEAVGEVGTRTVDDAEGLAAKTEFRVQHRCGDGTTLLEARLFTGRTNQIRVHLWDLGFPVCGDPVYLADHRLGTSQTLTLNDPPLCLHAWKLSFNHPLSKQRTSFQAELPDWWPKAFECGAGSRIA